MGTCRHPVSADLLRSWVVREREGETGREMTHREMGKDRRRIRGKGWLGNRVEGGKEKEKVTKQEEKEGASYNEGGKYRGRRKW